MHNQKVCESCGRWVPHRELCRIEERSRGLWWVVGPRGPHAELHTLYANAEHWAQQQGYHVSAIVPWENVPRNERHETRQLQLLRQPGHGWQCDCADCASAIDPIIDLAVVNSASELRNIISKHQEGDHDIKMIRSNVDRYTAAQTSP